MKQHPDGQPGCAIAVQRGDNNPGGGVSYFFDDDRIDGAITPGTCTLLVIRSSAMLNRAEREVNQTSQSVVAEQIILTEGTTKIWTLSGRQDFRNSADVVAFLNLSIGETAMRKRSVSLALLVIVLAWFVSSRVFTVAAGIEDQSAPVQKEQAPARLDKAEQEKALAEVKLKIAGHEDEPAEQVFKNIEILKGKKASRLPGMMSALTGLLGVDCTYCHVKDQWASEEKPTKQTARKMFRMIGTINKDNFEGRNAVSCWTCHRGSPHPPIQ
jgi:Photosynthetic reaction centre cytochrome C subunit